MNAPQLVAQSLRGQLFEPRILERLGKSDQHGGEAPELGLACVVVEQHRQAPDGAQAALDQLERPGQRQLARVARAKGLLVACRILQQVVAHGLFVAGQRNHVFNDALGRQLQRGRTRVIGQHFVRGFVEVGNAAFALAHQRGQRIGGGQGALGVALDGAGMIVGQVRDVSALLVEAGLLRLPHQAPGGGGGEQKDNDCRDQRAPTRPRCGANGGENLT